MSKITGYGYDNNLSIRYFSSNKFLLAKCFHLCPYFRWNINCLFGCHLLTGQSLRYLWGCRTGGVTCNLQQVSWWGRTHVNILMLCVLYFSGLLWFLVHQVLHSKATHSPQFQFEQPYLSCLLIKALRSVVSTKVFKTRLVIEPVEVAIQGSMV